MSMALQVFNMMNVLLVECSCQGVHIIRSNWEYYLMDELGILQDEDIDSQLRIRAMLVCLILSAASTDIACIKSTGKLKAAKLLDTVDALADASVEDIKACILEVGIQNNRAVFLKQAFCKLRDEFTGIVPTTVRTLMSLPGVGRKTAILLLNEGYGFFAGIGTDKHVCDVAEGLGLFGLTFELKKAHPQHVEYSLCKCFPQQ